MLLDVLRAGVRETQNFMAELTDYHGGPVTTEYLLVSDLTREFLKRRQDVGVEGLNRRFCNALTSNDPSSAAKALKCKRTDIFVGGELAPKAIIEVKIRISRYAGIARDLQKIPDTISHMNPNFQRMILGASVFQMHIKPTSYRCKKKHFVPLVEAFEKKLRGDLAQYEDDFTDYSLELKSLMATATDGIVDQELDEDIDGTQTVGRKGHATRYYAIIMKHILYGSTAPSNFSMMKAERSFGNSC